MKRWIWVTVAVVCMASPPAMAQVQVRVGDPGRATYSELHEALREGTPAADSVLAVMRSRSPRQLWRLVRSGIRGTAPWNDGLLALTRLAQIDPGPVADSAARLQKRIASGALVAPPGQDAEDLIGPITAVRLARARRREGDPRLLAELLARVPSGDYGLGEAWTLGRLRGASDSLQARFLQAPDGELKVRYLTLLSFADRESAVPLLARVYAAPDSFGIGPRYASRASDALLWIGTPTSLRALLGARAKARDRRVYADPALGRGGYDFLANDSSAVISRTGKWLTEWIRELPATSGSDTAPRDSMKSAAPPTRPS